MSVINQVLNQLEQRGAHTAAEQTMVRAVPQTRRSFTLPLLASGLAILIVIAVWQWVRASKPVLSSVEGPDVAAANIATKATQGNSAPAGAGNIPGVSELDKLALQQPVAIVAPGPDIPAANLPASRLSFELSSVPLPSSARRDSEHAVKNGKGNAGNRGVPVKSARKSAQSQPRKADTKNATGITSNSTLPMKQVSSAQRADAEFRKAVALMQQGRIADAVAGYESALRLDAGHDAARQALVALLLESKRGMDAERVLQERLKSKPDHTGFTMMLARLQVERGAVAEATATLEKALPYAGSQADYQAFLAAVLQRQNRNDEAIRHYQVVLQLAPDNGIWLMGYGISLQAMQRNVEAKAAFQRALDTQTLSPDLQAFVRQKLKGL